ncbi:MAG: WD40 repeat domain-containing serine/threonine-protein kinase [Planctomycetota bacterium]
MSSSDEQRDENQDESDSEAGRLDSFFKTLFRSKERSARRAPEKMAQQPSPNSSEFLDSEESDLVFLDPGTCIGTYKIIGLIGYGGFGVVYHAVNEATGQEVALKLPRPDRMNSGQVLKRFYREAKLSSGLKHRSIVEVIETSIQGEHLYIASEYQKCKDLKKWLELQEMPLAVDLVVSWGIDLADALQYAFLNGIVHRDLKPTNILIVEERSEVGADRRSIVTELNPRITDFGLAYSVKDPVSTTSASGMMLGTMGYMAPELVLNGVDRVDIRADVYALGLIMAEMLAGVRLRKFEHTVGFVVHLTTRDPSRDLDLLKQVIPEDLRAILLKTIEVEPEKRYQSPGELKDDLIRFRQGQPTLVRPLSLFDRSIRYARRNPYQAVLVAITAVFFMVFKVNQWGHNQEMIAKDNSMVRMAYNSKLRLGYYDLLDDRIAAVHETLDETRDMKSANGSALRDLSWNYLNRLASSKFTTHRIENFREYLPWKMGEIVQATYDKHKKHINNSTMLVGHFQVEDQFVRFENPSLSLTLSDSIFAIYRDSSYADGFIQYDGVRTERLKSPHANFIYSPLAKKMFYYSMNQDLKSDPLKPANGSFLVNTVFHGPRMSLDGSKITCLLKLEGTPSSVCSWAIYNTMTDEMVKTGVQFSVEGYAWNSFSHSEMSQRGKLAVLYAVDTGTIHIYDTVNRKERHRFIWPNRTGNNHPQSLAIDEVSDRLLVTDQQNKLYIIKIGESKPYAEFHNKMRSYGQVGFLPDGRVYGKWSFYDRIWIWNPDQPPSRDLELDHTKEVWSLAFDPLGETLASTGDDHRVHVWDLKTKTQKLLESHQSLVTCGKFSSDGAQYAACDFSGCLKIWDARTWKLLKSIQLTEQKLRALAWSPDGRSIVCVGGPEILKFDVSSDKVEKYQTNGTVYDILFSKSGHEIAVNVQNDISSISFFSFPDVKLIKELILIHNPTRMVLSPDGRTIVTGYDNGGIGVISSQTRMLQKHLDTEATFGSVWSLGFTSDGKNLIASGGDNRVILYETETWEPLGTIMDHKSRVHAISASSDGRKFATGDMSGKIIVRDTRE